ncbi:MAG: hypothetical protein GX977_12615, partial [Firmicutes bacterium]|nr:hypothetical protein [Bacillota bacterium]
LLASSLTSNPDFWRLQAETRREKYSELMELVDEKGVDLAYDIAAKEYAKLPLFDSDQTVSPEQRGLKQALEMFFTLLGIGSTEMLALRTPGSSDPQNRLIDGLNWDTERTMEV